MMKIGVIEYFDSMHLLPGHPKCGVPHGHTYKVEVEVEGAVINGMVIDFALLKQHLREILERFDHIDLNKILQYPSCENICIAVHKSLQEKMPDKKFTVRVWEGEGKWAQYSE